MANINAPFGFRPVMHLNGSSYNGQSNLYYVAASNGNAIYIGDAVISAATGDANGVPGVAKATAGTETVRGVVVGILGAYPGTSMQGAALNLEQPGYIPAANATAVYVLVADAADLVCEIQCGSVATNLTTANLNKNASFTVAAPSVATNPISGSYLANATIATTNTLNLKIRGLVKEPNNAVGAYQKVYVSFNLHELNNAGTTAI